MVKYKGKNYFIATSVVLISVMLAFNHKKMPLKKYKKSIVFMFLYIVHLKIECEIIAI